MYYLETGLDKHSRFRNATLLALAAHVAVILGVSFSASTAQVNTPQIEVTLITRASDKAPDDAKLIAVANQDGSGQEALSEELTSPAALPVAAAPPEPTPDQRDVVTTQMISEQLVNEEHQQAEPMPEIAPGIEEIDRLSREVATLEAELDAQARLLADRPRVRRLTAASAKQSADAAYLLDWRRRLEAVGNKYYPQASVRYGIYGAVRLLVVIRSDGSLEDIRVVESSGFAVLDEAAIKVVRMAAPYAPFPDELAATTDKLEIVRTWHYEENSLSSR